MALGDSSQISTTTCTKQWSCSWRSSFLMNIIEKLANASARRIKFCLHNSRTFFSVNTLSVYNGCGLKHFSNIFARYALKPRNSYTNREAFPTTVQLQRQQCDWLGVGSMLIFPWFIHVKSFLVKLLAPWNSVKFHLKFHAWIHFFSSIISREFTTF